MSDDAPSTAPEPAARDAPRRGPRGRRFLLLVVLPALAVLAGLGWWLATGRYVTTENAYVKASIVAISAEIDGRVVAVDVVDDQKVERGDRLFRLGTATLEIDLERAAAHLVSIRNQIEAWRAEFREVQAEIEEAEERASFYRQQADRQQALQAQGIAAAVRLEEAEMEMLAAGQQVAALKARLRSVLARLGGDTDLPSERHPAYQEAVTERDRAAVQLAKATVSAPISGVVSRMRLEPGEWVEAGEPVFTIVDPSTSWIEANLKETQLAHVRVGQRVLIGIDGYPDQRWTGQIGSISAATGAEFALIPPQNASGNWVKVVQRLPVRIELAKAADLPPLRAGMTASIEIDTERETALSKLFAEALASVTGER